MRAAKIDGNHRAIVDALRASGASVVSLAGVGKGCPDLLVGLRGSTWLVEVKLPKGRVNPRQAEWHAAWRGAPVIVMRSVDDAVAFVSAWCAEW